jgi:aryl-alcohol dehydrogenase-like predicted oxidoreductase
MADTSHPGGPDGFSRIDTTGFPRVARIGYGAMQLGDAPSPEDAAAVLRRAAELGVNHIDTASFYARGEVNHHIRRALAPYPDDLVIVSKVGAAPATGPIPLTAAQQPAQLRAAVEDDLRQLGLDCIPVVNLRRLDLGPGLSAEGDQIINLDDQLDEMIALRDAGKIGAIGISNVPLEVLRRALPAGIVCVQNAYSLLDRSHEGMLDFCTAEGIAWVPFFPLGSAFSGFPNVADNTVVREIADELGVTAAQVGLAWLLAHAPNTLLIPGTRSITHLEENIASADVALSPAAIARLDAVTTPEKSPQHQHGVAAFRKAATPG